MATKLFKRTNDKDVFDTIIEHGDPPAAEDTQAITGSDGSETSKTADSAPDDDNTATAPADTGDAETPDAPPSRRKRWLRHALTA
jgi:Mce-associated membrane protein